LISKSDAIAIALGHVNRSASASGLEFVVTQVQERNFTWVVYYNSRKYLETRDVLGAIAGNGPVVVEKASGNFVAAGTHGSRIDRIAEAEKRLGCRVL